MKLLISPAKKMREDGDFLAPRQAPALLERAGVPAGARAEQLSMEQFAAIARTL